MPPILSALVLWLSGTLLAATAWWIRTLRPGARLAVLVPMAFVLFAAAGLQPRAPVG